MRISNLKQTAGKLMSGLFILALIVVASCSKNPSADMEDILKTVPSDVSCVGVYDTENLIKKAGGKVDGDKAELNEDMKRLIEKTAGTDPQLSAVINAVMSGEAGVSFGPGAFFIEGRSAYITGMLSNPDDFKKLCEEKMQAQFTDTDGVSLLSNIAVKDNRFWIGTGRTSSINAGEINRFMALSDQQSFLSNEISEKMLKMSHDLEVWGNLNGLMNIGKAGLGNIAIYRMVLASLFDDAQDFYSTTVFEKGKMDSELNIINSKGKTAKFLLPTVKIDESTVKGLGSSASIVAALGIDKKLVSKIKELMMTFGGQMPQLYTSILDVLDGTACVAIGPDDNNVSAIVTTTGEGTAALVGLLNNLGTVNKDGKLLRVSKGTVSGNLETASAASMLDGSMLGIVMGDTDAGDRFTGVNSAGIGASFSNVAFLLTPADGGMKFRITGNCKDKEVNALEAILKSASSAVK